MIHIRRKLLIASALITSTLMLTSCLPSGNVVGSGEFIILGSDVPGVTDGDKAFFTINGGIVATPRAFRFRTTKASLTFSASSLAYTVSKYRDVMINDPAIPRSQFLLSKMKGRNVCGTFAGVTDQGPEISGLLYNPVKGFYSLYISIVDVGYFFAESNNAKFNIGGRNLCYSEG